MPSGRIKKIIKNPQLLTLASIYSPEISKSLSTKLSNSRVALNSDLLKKIAQMKQTAAHHCISYLTSNQIQSYHRVFLINRKLHLRQLTHTDYSQPEDYQVFINPEIVSTKSKAEQLEQNCLIFPFLKFKVPRYHQIVLKFRDQQKDFREETFTGETAQMVQHCIDHLNGQLLIDYQISHGIFYVEKDQVPYFPKTNFLLRQYSIRLRSYHERIEKGELHQQDESFKQMKKDYTSRLKAEYSRQCLQFSKTIQEKKYI